MATPTTVEDADGTPIDYYSSDDNAIDDSGDGDNDFVTVQRHSSQKRRQDREDSLEAPIQRILPFPFAPNIRPLTVSDLECCVTLETAAFPNPAHRATKEKIAYRLSHCPELCMGVFCTVVPEETRGVELATLPTARKVETDRQNQAVSVLLAHIISTASHNEVVRDSDIDYPRDWREAHGKSTAQAAVGHQQGGRTVAIHSLAVLPKVQACGLGKLIVKAFLQQMNNAGIADRVALICQDYLVSYYERFGFKHVGESKAQFGGGGWHDMVFDLTGPQDHAL